MITFVAVWAEQPKQILPITTATDVGWYRQNNSVNTITLPAALIVEQNSVTLTAEFITISVCQYQIISPVPEVALNLKYPLTNTNTNNNNNSLNDANNQIVACVNNTRQNFGGDKKNGDSII